MRHARPLPCAIVVMSLLVAVKTVGLVNAFDVSSAAQASTHGEPEKAEPKPSAEHAAGPAAMTPATMPPAAPAEPEISDARKRRCRTSGPAAKSWTHEQPGSTSARRS